MMIKMKNIKAIFRRGQTQASSKTDQAQIQPQSELSRSSSSNNLNVDPKSKGAYSKLRKSASKDRLDKLTEPKKNEKKGVNKNNNKLEAGENSYSAESLQEIDLLQKQLAEMAREKSDLALQLGEHKGQLAVLKNEILKLKMIQDQSNVQIDRLSEENGSLRGRLRDVAHSPLSDNEKQLLLDTHRHHSSAPASIATNLLDESTPGDSTACPTPDWDKHSSGNVSEVSVACLQDKINQMQETHYSTNEELQATLQELTDLQRQLVELQQENERLSEEKNLMFDSLCRQTERLKDTREEVESLKQLLYHDESGQTLVDLLKNAQEDRDALLSKREELFGELEGARIANGDKAEAIEQLTERVQTLESALDAKHAEHKQLDQELATAKDQCNGRQIEIDRLINLLETARTKVNELEQERALNDKSELDELLDNARKEKDSLESEVTHLKEQVALSRNESDKLKEQISILQEECKVTRNNAKCTQSELEYKCEKLNLEKANLTEQLQQLQEAANELQVQAQCQLEDKRQLSSILSETQRNLSDAERRNLELETEVDDLKKLIKDENDEWEKFQNDLLTSVRVANDFKSEAQQELQKMIMENKSYRERVRILESQLEKLKGGDSTPEIGSSQETIDSSERKASKRSIFKRQSEDTRQEKSGKKNLKCAIKHLSLQEEKNLELLDELYNQIDPAIPEEQLTAEQKFVVKLKMTFSEDPNQPKMKPIARKSKDKLAISKPLLTSVFSNPKLKEIAENPNLKQVDHSRFSDRFGGTDGYSIRSSFQAENRRNQKPEMRKSASFDDIYELKSDRVDAGNELTASWNDLNVRKTCAKVEPVRGPDDSPGSSLIFTEVPSENRESVLCETVNVSVLAPPENFQDNPPPPTETAHLRTCDLSAEEMELVEGIKNSCSRPNSDINEEDLKLIELAKQRCFDEDSNAGGEPRVEFREKPVVRKDVKSWDSHPKFVQDQKLKRHSLDSDEPIYANYSAFLKDMIHDDKEGATVSEISDSEDAKIDSEIRPRSDSVEGITSKLKDLTQNLIEMERFGCAQTYPDTTATTYGAYGNYNAPVHDFSAPGGRYRVPSDDFAIAGERCGANVFRTDNYKDDFAPPDGPRSPKVFGDVEKYFQNRSPNHTRLFGNVDKYMQILEATPTFSDRDQWRSPPATTRGGFKLPLVVEEDLRLESKSIEKDTVPIFTKVETEPIHEHKVEEKQPVNVIIDEKAEVEEVNLKEDSSVETFYDAEGAKPESKPEKKQSNGIAQFLEGTKDFCLKSVNMLTSVTHAVPEKSDVSTTTADYVNEHFLERSDSSMHDRRPTVVDYLSRDGRTTPPSRCESPNYDSLDRIAAFHVLNNPPPKTRSSSMSAARSVEIRSESYSNSANFELRSSRNRVNQLDNRSSFETARRVFEDMIATTSQRVPYEFKSETLKRASAAAEEKESEDEGGRKKRHEVFV